MNKKYFDNLEDNFESIIKKHYPKCSEIMQIETGWTNYVFKIKNNDKTYFFRFPRNDFFSDALRKELEFLKFIRPKIKFKVPNLRLYFHKKRPYSVHRGIEGVTLSEAYNSLSPDQKAKLSKDISKLIYQFSKINFNEENTYKNFQKVSDFLDDLSKVSQNNYDLSRHNHLKELENSNMILSHGDLNPGNLLLKKNRLVAVIDFAFAGISSDLVDLSRVLGRTPQDFKQYLIPTFEKMFNKKINLLALSKLEDTWRYVEEKYVLYIKQFHPSIKLPTLV